jgi:hypothetical protein
VQTDINRCKIRIWKERSKTELTLRRALRRLKSAMDCRASEEEEDENDDDDDE